MANQLETQLALASSLGLSELSKTAIMRGLFSLDGTQIKYSFRRTKSYQISDPEEKVRADAVAFLVLSKGYDSRKIDTEVEGSHNDFADIVLYEDDRCTKPWLVVENKKEGATPAERAEGEAQAFANGIALGAKYTMKDYGDESCVWQLEGFGARERRRNKLGDRELLPRNYSQDMVYPLHAGTEMDIKPASAFDISIAIRRAHSIIWAGGKRDPLSAFDEWSKLMFAKVRDERYTRNGHPRSFQAGVNESDSAIATRVHKLFSDAKEQDQAIFPRDEKIELPDSKVAQVVRVIQEISFIDTDSDVIGTAFEDFFGSVFRGSLGQYFTMRQIARFTVGMLNPTSEDYVLDPTCGSGGFLLETLLQVWNDTDAGFAGQGNLARIKSDFAAQNVYGIEIHPTLARICKISLLLHHDGHTNIEADKSCLSPNLSKPRLQKDRQFDLIVGNPPFGTKVANGDEDQLDGAFLDDFVLGCGKQSIQSEQIILEKSVSWLKPGGRLGMVLPDGVLNNSGSQSNCPALREWLFKSGRILSVISLPDFAFRRSGATNKTSILIFEKFSDLESARLGNQLEACEGDIAVALKDSGLDYNIFFGEASHIGYTPSGRPDPRNDLYIADENGYLSDDQTGSILGEWNVWEENGAVSDPRCVAERASSVWRSHPSHRVDPKYHVYMAHKGDYVPHGWSSAPMMDLVKRMRRNVDFGKEPMKEYKVLTLSQTGVARLREPGVGNNPPEWRGMYFYDSSSDWFEVRTSDIVYSGIDLWKGVVCFVTEEFDHALVTQEYPILRVKDQNVIDPEFLSILLRSRRFQKAFRAINTGHSNRRRTQSSDFGKVLVYYPPIEKQKEIALKVRNARENIAKAYIGVSDVENELDAILHADDEWDETTES